MSDPLSPRKRPRQKRSAATVEVILDGAARILEREGLDAFNTNAVAVAAGVSVGSLYQYFPGKDAVMAALLWCGATPSGSLARSRRRWRCGRARIGAWRSRG